ncbi:MAG TPA: hypothetical protein ENJ82_15025 [Bacteroidetes bacterium]|nr:hypothetical protein [Bacteroidota bacterium]
MEKKKESSPQGTPPDITSDKKVVSAAHYASRIEAVKDLIFGEDNAEIRTRLEQLDEKIDAQITALNERLSGVIDDQDKTTLARIDNMEMDLKAEIDRLDHSKADRVQLGKMLMEMGKALLEE